jgi:hypothetical protein
MSEIIEKLNSIPIDTKITLILTNIFNQPFTYKCKLSQHPKEYGFVSETLGGWSSLGDEKYCIQDYLIYVIPYKCRSESKLNCHRIKDVIIGWNWSVIDY